MPHPTRITTKLSEELSGPVRMCVICRQRFSKDALTRYTLDENGSLRKDAQKTSPGRGWYVCSDEACLAKFTKYRPAKRRTGKKK